MNHSDTQKAQKQVITPEELLKHWLGHRRVTRKVIQAFPEKEFFEYCIGGMRPFSKMVLELLRIAGPGMKEIVSGKMTEYKEEATEPESKEEFLRQWDLATGQVQTCWSELEAGDFHRKIKLFGQYEGTVISSIQYFIDNEIHHRAQGYVYLRALGIEPPAFYDRS